MPLHLSFQKNQPKKGKKSSFKLGKFLFINQKKIPSVNCNPDKQQNDNPLQPNPRRCSLFPNDKPGLRHLSGSAPSVACGPTASPLTTIPLTPSTSRSRQKKFLRHFDVHPEERVIDYFSCALVADILLQGHLYISKNYFAFYSNVFGYVTKLLIPVSNVTSLTKEKTAFILPNAVAVTTTDDRHVFSSLLSRDTTYKLMVQVWRDAQVDVESAPDKVRLRSVVDRRAPLAEAEVSLSEKSVSCHTTPTLQAKHPDSSPGMHTQQNCVTKDKNPEVSRLAHSTVLQVASTLLLVVLFLSAAVLLYRLSLLHHRLTTVPSSPSQRSLQEVQEYLDANLQKLHNVRQSLEALSILMEDERERLQQPRKAQEEDNLVIQGFSNANQNKINTS